MAEGIRFNQLVVIGSSAGGIDALSTLVSTLPDHLPAPIVIAQHLDPKRPSHLTEILSSRSPLPVRTVTEHAELQPGVVFVVPASWHVEITEHDLHLRLDAAGGPKPSVDLLFRSAAEVFGEGLIAVVLTGTGSDGAAGARSVKEAGGTVVIQNPDTASFPSMPQSLAPTTVDIVAELDRIGPILHELLIGAYTAAPEGSDRTLSALLDQLRERSGIDFSAYKMPTIMRRLQRRMAATNTASLVDYIRVVQRNPEEYRRLVSSFLIKVTGFFRDIDLFDYLRERGLPRLIEEARARDGELRIWSAGCATGEEAYSLAMLVTDLLRDELDSFHVRIFATDLDADAVEFARRGVYPASALRGMSSDQISRYFVETDGEYAVKKNVRALVVFGQHDLGQRAPFPRIDLALCRNVLIYFTPELQRRSLQLFAFSLRDGGLLALGKAETTSPLDEHWSVEQSMLKVYRRKGGAVLIPPLRAAERPTPSMGLPATLIRGAAASDPPHSRAASEDPRRLAGERAEMLRMALPVGVALVDRHYDIQWINNAARRSLGIRASAVGEDLIHLARGVPSQDLRVLIDAALRGQPSTRLFDDVSSGTVTGERRALRVSASPPSGGKSGLADGALLLVEDVTETTRHRTQLEQAVASERETAERLSREAEQLERSLQEMLEANEELISVNAELRSTNEELLVANEEVYASTEEVETLNEEMQATNEELETLNEELQATVEELNTTNDDLQARSIELQDLAISLEAQRHAAESERQRLAAILASIADGVLVVDAAGTPVLTNGAFEETFGEAGERLALADDEGRPLPAEQNPLRRAAAGESFTMEFTVTGEDGERRWYEARGQAFAAAGEPRGGVVVIRDITERSLRRLQEEFIERASHELRTPLTGLQLYLEMVVRLVERDSTDARLPQYASNALGQARRLALRVNDLQDAARLRHGGLRLDLEPIEMGPVVREAVDLVQLMAQGRTVQLSEANRPLWVTGDPHRLEQVVLNLLTNAISHAAKSERIDVRLRPEDGQAVLEIQDYGPGIPHEMVPRLFSRFYRAQAEASGSGLGLGLFISKEIVSAHGGTVAVETEVGKGAKFIVRLPLRPDR